MFLNKLTNEEKISFLKLAHHIARIDGDFSENEQKIISAYCTEMQIQDIIYDKNDFNLDTILTNVTNKESQKIFLLEIMALIYADGLHIDKEEQKILDIIIDKYHISDTLYSVYLEWSKTILSIINQGYALISL